MTISQFQVLRPLNLSSLKLTDEQFYQLCITNPEQPLELTSEGVLIVMPPVGGESGNREADLLIDLGIWNRQTQRGSTSRQQHNRAQRVHSGAAAAFANSMRTKKQCRCSRLQMPVRTRRGLHLMVRLRPLNRNSLAVGFSRTSILQPSRRTLIGDRSSRRGILPDLILQSSPMTS